MKRLSVSLLVAAISIITLAGCAAFNKVSLTYQKTTTTGKELLDLKAAKDAGLLSDVEYMKLRDEVVRSATNLMSVGSSEVKAK
jgi:hypothetical protein